MYRQKIPQKTTSPLVNSTPISNAVPTSSYGSLSSIVQRAQQDVSSISGDERQHLDSAIGTKATGEVLAGKQWTPQFRGVSSQLWGNAGIQAKLTIGEVGDKYEQEADRVAASVVQQINRPTSVSNVQSEVLQGKEEELRMKPIVQRREGITGGEASAELSGEIDRARGGGQPLEGGLQQSMEQAMGADFSGVRVHRSARADSLNQSLSSRAFTTGQDIFFRQGAYQPESQGGRELLAHELTHVIQQDSGIVQPSMRTQGLSINRKSNLEHGTADVTGSKIPQRYHSKFNTTTTNILNRRNRAVEDTSVVLQAPIGVSRKKTGLHCLSSPILQCKKVHTSFGTFEDEKYTKIDTDQEKGVDIILTFDPGYVVNATKIGMVQSVKTYIGNLYLVRNEEQAAKLVKKEGKSEGYKIDRLMGATNPIYGGENLAEGEDLSATQILDSHNPNPIGRLGWRYPNPSDSGEIIKSQKALLDDSPRLPTRSSGKYGQLFESTALAIEGKQKGIYYGSVSWGWTVDDQGKFTKKELTLESGSDPTPKFMDAVDMWNAFKSRSRVKKLGQHGKNYETIEPFVVNLVTGDVPSPKIYLATGTKLTPTETESEYAVLTFIEDKKVKFTKATNFNTFDFPLDKVDNTVDGESRVKEDTPINFKKERITIKRGTKVKIEKDADKVRTEFTSGTIEPSKIAMAWINISYLKDLETTDLPKV